VDIETTLRQLADNQTVQGELLSRMELSFNQRLDAVLSVAKDNAEHIQALVTVAESHEERIQALVTSHQEQIAELRAAMAKLFERMDRLLEGRGGDGHRAG
jgi:phosphoribosylaminoimidazole-succinocarboxamide synthase